MQTDGWPELNETKQPEMTEQDLLQAKSVILTWIKDLRAQPEVRLRFKYTTNTSCSPDSVYSTHTFHPQQSVWPGEPVAKVLEDLQSAWRWGRVPNLMSAMELVFWTLMVQRPDKVEVQFTA